MRTAYSLLPVLFTLLFAGCRDQQMPSPGAQLSTSNGTQLLKPEEVLEKFYQSLAESNENAALACTTGDQLSREFVESQVRLNSAFVLMGRNAIERFPEDGIRLQSPLPALAAMKKIKEIPVAIAGETATWPSNPSAPLKLIQVNGVWKLDLAKSFPSPETLRKSNGTYDTIAGYLTDVANDVAAGKYASVELVQQEVKRRGQAVGR